LILILLRTAVTAVILTVPFVLLALSHQRAEGAIWLMFPVILFIPVLVGSLFVLAPAEALSKSFGLNPNIVLPLVGGCVGALVVAVAIKWSSNPEALNRLLSGDVTTVGAAIGIVLVGAVIGVAWRVSLWILKSLQWA
jgi:sterol desaturase/sphingolipid hydroxylase (fatty acid hydroxylase superfamily)